MPDLEMLKTVTKEYGILWAFNRALYSVKLKMLGMIPATAKLFEKTTVYPTRLNLFEIDTAAIKRLLEGLSEQEKTDLIQTADNACQGTIKGFSSLEFDYGKPIDWQLNPLTGKRCNEKLSWFKIPDFDKERGDIKVIWEASRFSHFITLARAYLLTGDRKYYQAFSEQLDDWLKKNPYGYGANFKCSQECSLRLVNGLLVYTVFKKVGLATDADRSNVRELIDRCYRKVLSNFFYAYKCIKNNHTISELMGMIVGAWCCEDEKQLDQAVKLLDEVIDEQFTDDGGYRQFSFNYQRLALQDIECVLSIEGNIGRKLSEKSKRKVKASAILVYQCQDESGDVPNYGSNDGALVFPVNSCGYRDFKSVINTVYALTAGNQIYDDGSHQEELLWFSGGKRLDDYPKVGVKRVASQFPDAGLFTMRNPNSWAMIVLNDYESRPAHMDQFHFDLWIDGVNVLCDSGTYSYATEIGRQLVRNESHNTAVIEGKPQMKSSGPFMIYDWTKRRIERSEENYFEGTLVSANGYTHFRKIEKICNGFRIIDNVDTNWKASKSIVFHTPCDVVLESNMANIFYNADLICSIKSTGNITKFNTQRSVYYLKRENITRISVDINNIEKCITEITVK